MKYLKYALYAVVALVVLLVAAVAIIASTFDPNSYKPQIVQLVKDKTGRTLIIDGDIKLKFFPKIGAQIGKVSLSEHGTDKEFAGLTDVQVFVALMPLLSKQVVVDERGRLGIAPVGHLCLTFDHRAMDGAYAAAFLGHLQEIVETRDWSAEL